MPDDMAGVKYWQLPTVFIFESDVSSYKRIHPFDSGAFESGLYPKFVDMMPRNEYELSGNVDYPQKIVSSFFVNAERYFKLKPRAKKDFERRFEIGATDEEIRALYDLIEHYDGRADDRRFAIELQTENEISISSGHCKAIILPEEYLESEELMKVCEDNSIEVMSYPTYPLKQEMYYYAIYNAVFELYKDWGYVK